MNFYIQQSIQINLIKIGGITNSSVLQIGSAGIIKPSAHLYNTGGFTEPAPEASTPFTEVSLADEASPVSDTLITPGGTPVSETALTQPAVPLAGPARL